MNERKTTDAADMNRDPITGEPGAHPVGAGVGAALGGAGAGALAGAVAGPIGAAVGAVVGGVAGGLAGKATAESIDPTAEDAHWRKTYGSRPYASKETSYDTYAPAYRHGWESRSKYAGKKFDDVEVDLKRDWEASKSSTALGWDKAKLATRDAWDRLETKRT